MSVEPEVALEEFLSAIRAHFQAAAHRTSATDENVQASYTALADAFEAYDDAIFASFDEVTPFELYDDIEDEREDDDDDIDFGDEEFDEVTGDDR